ncbi:hypothetical protein A2783_02200 [Microgenomates group bacterium RIFCSPHIGHO2_01_FULL_45_11]|nr:MAG: hypothetical protein A2783_02200 [Microgenomates group bacterium RIFCSPHIGHO2_01_FULL_45_11]
MWSSIWPDTFVVIGITICFGFIFLYRLGYQSLQSFDEAWYAAIARNLATGKAAPFFSQFNGAIYTDHPPLGFWLMAASMRLFGINEWAARFPLALAGVGGLLACYWLARSIGGKQAGLVASLMLGSSLWYVFRSRSANLDILVSALMTVAVALLVSALKKPRLIYLAALGWGLALLSKSVVALTLLPGFFIWFLIVPLKIKPKLFLFAGFVLILLAIVIPWYRINYLWHSNSIFYNLFTIGLRSGTNHVSLEAVNQNLLYLRSGIGKWYYPGLISLPVSVFLVFLKKIPSTIIYIYVWLLAILTPLALSAKTEVWHLIPAYPPLMVVSAITLFALIRLVATHLTPLSILGRNFIPLLATATVAVLALLQLKSFWTLVIPSAFAVSQEADIAKKAAIYHQPLYLKAYFWPAAVYYSGQDFITFLDLAKDAHQVMVTLLRQQPARAMFIVPFTELDSLSQEDVNFTVLERNSAYALITGAD